MDTVSLPECRNFYARQVLARGGVADNARLLAAFSSVPRERYIGPPPWFFAEYGGYREVPSADPAVLYQDVLVALDAQHHINNGSPSLHARAMDRLAPASGETVAHIGSGTGYYSAILAELVGPEGHVTAVEYDDRLAARARECLSLYAQVEVVHDNGADWPQRPSDIVYVNFATDRPQQAWIDNLRPGGRLIFPLGAPARTGNGRLLPFASFAAYILIRAEAGGYAASMLCPVSFVWAEGMEHAAPSDHLRMEEAFRRGGLERVRSLRWKCPLTADEWYGQEDWGLSYADIPHA